MRPCADTGDTVRNKKDISTDCYILAFDMKIPSIEQRYIFFFPQLFLLMAISRENFETAVRNKCKRHGDVMTGKEFRIVLLKQFNETQE